MAYPVHFDVQHQERYSRLLWFYSIAAMVVVFTRFVAYATLIMDAYPRFQEETLPGPAPWTGPQPSPE